MRRRDGRRGPERPRPQRPGARRALATHGLCGPFRFEYAGQYGHTSTVNVSDQYRGNAAASAVLMDIGIEWMRQNIVFDGWRRIAIR